MTKAKEKVAIAEVGMQNKSIQQMHSQQKYQWQKFTTIWHVDDLKISHINKDIVQDILSKLNQRLGKENPMAEKS